MEEVKILKIHDKNIICKIKRIKSKRNLSFILSYGQLRITCSPTYSINRIKEILEENMTKSKVDKIFSDYLVNDVYIYLLGEKRNIVVLEEGQNASSMNDIIVRKRKDVDKMIDKFALKVFTERVRKYERLMNTPIFHEVKIRKFDRAYGKNFYGTKKQIVLEKRMIHFGLEIIDHTIMHEIAHDFYHDHSKNFYDILKKYCPNYKQLKEKLNYGVRK